MKTVMLAGVAILINGTAFAQSSDAFLGRDLRDRGDHDVLAADSNRELYRLTR